MEIMNKARGFAYIFGVLRSQEADPFCCSCSAFVNTLAAVRQNLAEFEAGHVPDSEACLPSFPRGSRPPTKDWPE